MYFPFNLPWRVDRTHGGDCIVDAHERVVCVPRHDAPELAALLCLAPEMLRDIATLVDALCRLDEAYCARHGLPAGTADQVTEALADAIALINHAHDQGIPFSAAR